MSILAEIHQRHQRFHAEIARRAALVQPKPVLVFTPPKRQESRPEPIRRLVADPKVPQTMPEWYPFMWFWDLIDIRSGPPATIVIQTAVCKHYGVTLADILCSKRIAKFVEPRQVAMYLCKEFGRTLPEIGRRFGGRDHTTVLHAWRKISGWVDRNPQFAATINELKAEVRR